LLAELTNEILLPENTVASDINPVIHAASLFNSCWLDWNRPNTKVDLAKIAAESDKLINSLMKIHVKGMTEVVNWSDLLVKPTSTDQTGTGVTDLKRDEIRIRLVVASQTIGNCIQAALFQWWSTIQAIKQDAGLSAACKQLDELSELQRSLANSMRQAAKHDDDGFEQVKNKRKKQQAVIKATPEMIVKRANALESTLIEYQKGNATKLAKTVGADNFIASFTVTAMKLAPWNHEYVGIQLRKFSNSCSIGDLANCSVLKRAFEQADIVNGHEISIKHDPCLYSPESRVNIILPEHKVLPLLQYIAINELCQVHASVKDNTGQSITINLLNNLKAAIAAFSQAADQQANEMSDVDVDQSRTETKPVESPTASLSYLSVAKIGTTAPSTTKPTNTMQTNKSSFNQSKQTNNTSVNQSKQTNNASVNHPKRAHGEPTKRKIDQTHEQTNEVSSSPQHRGSEVQANKRLNRAIGQSTEAIQHRPDQQLARRRTDHNDPQTHAAERTNGAEYAANEHADECRNQHIEKQARCC
jgi:hypothetical protein